MHVLVCSLCKSNLCLPDARFLANPDALPSFSSQVPPKKIFDPDACASGTVYRACPWMVRLNNGLLSWRQHLSALGNICENHPNPKHKERRWFFLIIEGCYVAFIRGVSNTKKGELRAGLPVKENKILTLSQGQKAPFPVKEARFWKAQEAWRKDIERAFGVLQAQFAIIRDPAHF
jgi:hypothetical protein